MAKTYRKPPGWDEGFLCLDCGADTLELAEYYMVKDTVWEAAKAPEEAMLCIGCLEARLDRELNLLDFAILRVNVSPEFRRSARLLDRLGPHYPSMVAEWCRGVLEGYAEAQAEIARDKGVLQ